VSICLSTQQALVVGQRHIDMGAILFDQVGVFVDYLLTLVCSAAFEPLLHTFTVVFGCVRLGQFAAKKQGDGIGARLAESAAAEFSDGDDIEILQENFAGADVGGAAVGEDRRWEDDGR